jgi:hypothetical protein
VLGRSEQLKYTETNTGLTLSHLADMGSSLLGPFTEPSSDRRQCELRANGLERSGMEGGGRRGSGGGLRGALDGIG